MTTQFVFRKDNQETVLGTRFFQRPGDRFGFQWSFYPPSANQMKELMAGGVVVNEYGEEYDPELFWDMVVRYRWNVDYAKGTWQSWTKSVAVASENDDDREFMM